jgi:hypothetical protein
MFVSKKVKHFVEIHAKTGPWAKKYAFSVTGW